MPDADDQPGAAPDLFTVHVLGLPVGVQTRAQAHSDELVRELTLIGQQLRQEGNDRALPARLLDLVEQLTGAYSQFTAGQDKQLADAIAAGEDTIDLTYRIPRSAADAAQALDAILDEADDYCREGKHLLTLATPDELVAYRRWMLSQFTGQASGEPPVSWAEYQR